MSENKDFPRIEVSPTGAHYILLENGMRLVCNSKEEANELLKDILDNKDFLTRLTDLKDQSPDNEK